jgi:hypothetical protein
MCGFQPPGLGFFYFPNTCANKIVKECAASIVITVLEGNSTQQLEMEFNKYLAQPGGALLDLLPATNLL